MAVGQEKLYETSDDTGSQPQSMYGGYEEAPRPSLARRFIDSFKPDPNVRAAREIQSEGGGKVYDVEAAAAATAQSPLARKLKGRHLQMIAIGGSIGKAKFALVAKCSLLIVLQELVYSLDLVRHWHKVVPHLCSLPLPSSVLCFSALCKHWESWLHFIL